MAWSTGPAVEEPVIITAPEPAPLVAGKSQLLTHFLVCDLTYHRSLIQGVIMVLIYYILYVQYVDWAMGIL